MHFYLDYSVALTGFASTALDIKGKSSGVITPYFGVGGFGIKLSYVIKNSDIRGGI